MTPASHLLVGIALGKVTGDYYTSILVSTLVDVDHIIPFAKHGVFKSKEKFFNTIFGKEESHGDERAYLHNVLVALALSGIVFLISKPVGVTFALAYLGHFVLDGLDTSDFWPFYPNKSITLRGFVKYLSWREIIFDVLLLVVIAYLFLV